MSEMKLVPVEPTEEMIEAGQRYLRAESDTNLWAAYEAMLAAAPQQDETKRSFPKVDTRPKRDGWAPGDYCNTCHRCSCEFVGDKRANTCADCAYGPEDELARLYRELLYAVERKFPGESRHETALRYIRNAERMDSQSGASLTPRSDKLGRDADAVANMNWEDDHD